MDDGSLLGIPDTADSETVAHVFYGAVRGGSWAEALRELCRMACWKDARFDVRSASGMHIAAASSSTAPSAQCISWQRIDLSVEGAAVVELWISADTKASAQSAVWLRLRPHLERALSLALDRLQQTWRAEQLIRDANATPIGRIVIGTDLRVHYANRAACAMAGTGDAFTIDRGTLMLRRPSDQAVIASLMAQELPMSTDRPILLQWLRRSGRWPYAVRIAPMRSDGRWCVELTLIDREPDDPPCDPLMLAGFDLTPGEAKVVRGLLEGYTHEEIAARSGIVRGTAKLHAVHAMKKLGVQRRPQLMRRLLAPLIARVPVVEVQAPID